MRGAAALYVVIQHARGYLFVDTVRYEKYVRPKVQWHWWEWLNTMIVQHTNLGKEFVIVFFVLSGFCIMHSVSSERGGIKGFFIRRFVRIYPTYILGILWAIVVFFVLRAGVAWVFNNSVEANPPLRDMFDAFVNVRSLLLNAFYLPTDNYLTLQYWSLPLEIIFYLLIPFFVRSFGAYTIFSIVTFIAGLFWTGINYLDEHKFNLSLITIRYLFDYNIYFFIGCVFYRYRDFFLSIYKMDRMRSLISLMLIFLLSVFVKSYLFEQYTNKITGLMMVLFTYIMLISGLKHQVRIKWLEWIGSFSYTLYVTHIATLFLVKLVLYRLGYNFYDIFLVFAWYLGVIVSVLFGWLLYYFAEYPCKQYLQRLREKPFN
jgi:peptidoglycan/LPS O-acetylase OafA/YrhL